MTRFSLSPWERAGVRVLAAALILAIPTQADAQQVTIQTPEIELQATYTPPKSPAKAPAIVALHGCGGPFPARDNQWRDLLAAQGHPILFPDSFGSRGLGSQCTTPNRTIGPNGKRRTDTVAAAKWLATQPTTPPGGPAGNIVVMGWSNGGSTVLAAAAQGVMPPGIVRGFVAFYPGCKATIDRPEWAPSAPLLIVMGEADDWTSPEPCRQLAARFPTQIKLVLYPGAYHDFDAPNRPVTTRTGLAFTANNNGIAHVGTNPEAREAAMRDVPAWIEQLPPAH